jgi:DNA-directed RNA polymerase specialized sigma24 family protein
MSAHKKREQRLPEFIITNADGPLIDKLPIEQKEVLMATGSYQSIADALRVPIGTVKSRLYRARTALLGMRAMAGR